MNSHHFREQVITHPLIILITGSIETLESRSNEQNPQLSRHFREPVDGCIVDADADGDLLDGFSPVNEPARQLSHPRGPRLVEKSPWRRARTANIWTTAIAEMCAQLVTSELA